MAEDLNDASTERAEELNLALGHAYQFQVVLDVSYVNRLKKKKKMKKVLSRFGFFLFDNKKKLTFC